MYAKKRQKTQNEGFLPFFYEQRARQSLNDRLTSHFATASLLYGKGFYNTGRYLYFYGMRNRIG